MLLGWIPKSLTNWPAVCYWIWFFDLPASSQPLPPGSPCSSTTSLFSRLSCPCSFLRISPFHSISFAHPLPPFLFSSIFQPLFSFLFIAHVSAYPFLREFPQTALAKCVAPHCKLSPRQFPTLFYMFPVCCPFHSPQHPSEVVLAPWHSGGNWGTEQWNSWSTVTGLVWGRTKLEPPCWSSEPIILQPFG